MKQFRRVLQFEIHSQKRKWWPLIVSAKAFRLISQSRSTTQAKIQESSFVLHSIDLICSSLRFQTSLLAWSASKICHVRNIASDMFKLPPLQSSMKQKFRLDKRSTSNIYKIHMCSSLLCFQHSSSWSGGILGRRFLRSEKTNRQPALRLIKFSKSKNNHATWESPAAACHWNYLRFRSLSYLLWILSRAKQRRGEPRKKYEMRFLKAINAWLDLHKKYFPPPPVHRCDSSENLCFSRVFMHAG